MAANTFLKLTNRILKAFNEVNLTDANFASADGFYQEAKDAVNQAIFDIYTHQDIRWPFAWATTSFTTTADVSEYTKNSAAIVVEWESFKIAHDTVNEITADHLPLLSYEVYRREFWQRDAELAVGEGTQPTLIVRKPDNNFILTPVPDKVYTVKYEYFTLPAPLEAASDTTAIPEQFTQVIVDQALHYAYMFRDNLEQANVARSRYENNVNKMRRILIPQFTNVVTLG